MAKPTLAQIQACASKAEVDALILNQADPTNVGCSNITRCTRCENCQSCTDCDNSTGCSNCVNCDNCTNCKQSTNLNNCRDCQSCKGAGDTPYRSSSLYQCTGCIECRRCIGEVDGRGLANRFCGVQLTVAQFDTVWALLGIA